MSELFASSTYFGFVLSLGTFALAKAINKKAGKEVCNPLLSATIICCVVLLSTGTTYETYYESGAKVLDFLLTPATVCLAIPLYRQFALLRKNTLAVAAGCMAGVLANVLGCLLVMVIFRLDSAGLATLLPKSITTAIGKSMSEELGGYPAITMVCIMVTGLFGAVAAPALLKLFRVTEPLAQGLAIGTASHAAGTSRAVEIGDVQGAASSLAIVVTGLLTVVVAPVVAGLVM